MSEQTGNKVVNFKETKSKTVKIEKDKIEIDKSKQSETTDTQSNQDSVLAKKCNDAESESSNHIKNIDLYDRLNFQRLQFKRSSLKCKTNICVKPTINIQKITEEIYKYVEDIEPQQSNMQSSKSIARKRTIKFATQKVTYQYPKMKEVITSNFGDNKQEGIDENDEDEKDDKKNTSSDNIFVFGENHDNEDEESHTKEDDKEKQHINLELFEEKQTINVKNLV